MNIFVLKKIKIKRYLYYLGSFNSYHYKKGDRKRRSSTPVLTNFKLTTQSLCSFFTKFFGIPKNIWYMECMLFPHKANNNKFLVWATQ